MSSASHPTYAPDPPSRFRWVPPLMIGLAAGGLIGCLLTFVLTALAQRSQAKDLAAEQFSIQRVLSAVPGAGGVSVSEDDAVQLGRLGGRDWTGSAVRRKVRLQGSVPKDADPTAFAQQVRDQVEAELGRHIAYVGSGGSGTSTGGGEVRANYGKEYHTRDGRVGRLDLELYVINGRVDGILILTEGR